MIVNKKEYQYNYYRANKEKYKAYMKEYMAKKRVKELAERIEQERLQPSKKLTVKKSMQHIKRLLKKDCNDEYEYKNILQKRSRECMQKKRKIERQDLIDKKRQCEI